MKSSMIAVLVVAMVLVPVVVLLAGTVQEEMTEKLVAGSPWSGSWDRGETEFAFVRSPKGKLTGELVRMTGSQSGAFPGLVKWLEVSEKGVVTFTTPAGTDIELRLAEGELHGTWSYTPNRSSGWVRLAPKK